jgi:hypothetical protein
MSSTRRLGRASSGRPGGVNTRRAGAPHAGHGPGELASAIGRTSSNGPQLAQSNA